MDEELAEMAQLTSEKFTAQEKTFCLVESCTGGLIASAITKHAGASSSFERAYITYSNQAKMDCVNVRAEVLDEFGAVSMQCAIDMALGGLKESGVNACVSVTGIAGPDGGADEKPVGLVYIAVANDFEPGAFGEEFNFQSEDRNEIQTLAAKSALEMLLAYGLDQIEH